jgi:hypothetical protein
MNDTGVEVHTFHAEDFFTFNPFAERGILQYYFRSPLQHFRSLMQFASIALTLLVFLGRQLVSKAVSSGSRISPFRRHVV